MLTFVVRRVLQSIPLLLLISMILFGIISEAPGGPLTPYLQNPHITAADIARLKHNLGLDQPVPIQYLHWLGQVLHGDFGYSMSNSEPTINAIQDRMPVTFELMGTAIGTGADRGRDLRHHLGRQAVLVDRLHDHDAGVLRSIDAGVLVRADGAARVLGVRLHRLRLPHRVAVGRQQLERYASTWGIASST